MRVLLTSLPFGEHAAFHLPGRPGAESALAESDRLFPGLLLHLVDDSGYPGILVSVAEEF